MQTMTLATSRLRTHCWVDGPADGEPLLLVHGNLTTGRFYRALADALPQRFRVVAPDLRSFGRTEALPVDASRGLRDWSDDLRALLESLGWTDGRRVHAAGWSMGGGILQQYEIDHPGDLATLTLLAPLSPFGFGGTRDADGTPCHADFAGSGGGTASPEFVRRHGRVRSGAAVESVRRRVWARSASGSAIRSCVDSPRPHAIRINRRRPSRSAWSGLVQK